MIIERSRRTTALLTLAATTLLAVGVAGCSTSGSSGQATSAGQASIPAGASTTAVANKTDSGTTGSAVGQPSTDQVCTKLPVSDAQALIVPKLSAAVVDPRLGGCTFLLPGKTLGDANLTVVFEVGGGAAGRYTDAVNGTLTIDGTAEPGGTPLTKSLTGVGDKAVWGTVAGFPQMSALHGDVYCSVSTADAGNDLTIIGSSSEPLPQGTPAQDLQYVTLEGKLCTDLFGLVH